MTTRLRGFKSTLVAKFRVVVVLLLCIHQTASLKAFKLGSKASLKAYKPGDVMFGGLCVLHYKNSQDECGDFFLAGLGHVEAMIYAIDQINQDPSILPNMTLGYDIRDYCETVSLAMENTYEFVRNTDLDQACANSSGLDNATASCCQDVTKYLSGDSAAIATVIGPYDSASSVQVGSLLGVAGIPIISYAATSDELSSRQYRGFFRTLPADSQQAHVQADIFERFNWTYVGAVALDDSYGRFGVSALETEAFTRKTFCIAFAEFIPRLGAVEKVKQIVTRLKQRKNVKVIVLWVFGGISKLFFKEASEQNLGPRTWILSDATTTEDKDLFGRYFGQLDGALGIQPHDHRDDKFVQYLTSLTPWNTSNGTNPWWAEYWARRLNCSTEIANRSDARACSSVFNASVSRNASLSRKQADHLFDPYLAYLVDAVFAAAHALDKMYKCRESQGLHSSCPQVKPSTETNALQFYLRNIRFTGLTGTVEFDESGDRVNSYYEIVNVQLSGESSKKLLVGSWNSDDRESLRLNASAIKWFSGADHWQVPSSFCSVMCQPGSRKEVTSPCCWTCVTCPGGTISTQSGSTVCTECPKEQKSNEAKTKCVDLPKKNLRLKSLTGASLACVAVLGFCLTGAAFVVFFKYRETAIVKVSNRQLSFLLLVSICLSFVLAFLSIVEPTDFLCRLTQFSRYIIYTTFVSILWLKTVRIFVVFQFDADTTMPVQRWISKFKYQVALVALVNSIEVLFLIVWFVVDPPSSRLVVRPTEYVFYACSPFTSVAGKALYFSICTYVLLLSLLSSFYAFKVRKLPDNFNEARFIGFSLYIILLSALCYYPVEFALEGWYVAVIASTTTLVDSFGLLGCMFGPKIFNILFHPERNSKAIIRSEVSAYCFQTTQLPNMNVATNKQPVDASANGID